MPRGPEACPREYPPPSKPPPVIGPASRRSHDIRSLCKRQYPALRETPSIRRRESDRESSASSSSPTLLRMLPPPTQGTWQSAHWHATRAPSIASRAASVYCRSSVRPAADSSHRTCRPCVSNPFQSRRLLVPRIPRRRSERRGTCVACGRRGCTRKPRHPLCRALLRSPCGPDSPLRPPGHCSDVLDHASGRVTWRSPWRRFTRRLTVNDVREPRSLSRRARLGQPVCTRGVLTPPPAAEHLPPLVLVG